MGNYVREGIMDLDLNQEPLDAPDSMMGLGSLLTELETAHGRIEERIRQLEAVTIRARQRQRWRHSRTNPQTVNISSETTGANVQNSVGLSIGEVGVGVPERAIGSGKFRKRDGAHLIAKALGMETDSKSTEDNGGGFFDCHICLDMARNPILTCCGHLFCWPCFYQLSYAHSNVKECPVCKGEVTDTSIIPIYGNGSDGNSRTSKSKEIGLKVPPRPHAHRIESLRQQLINRGAMSSPIEERFEQFSNLVDALEEWTRSLDLYRTSQQSPGIETEGNRRLQSLQVSRLLLQGAASISSLSSVLNSAMDTAERLAQDLEAYMLSRLVRRSHQESSHVDRGSTAAVVVQPESQGQGSASEINSGLPPSTSSFGFGRIYVASDIVHSEQPTTDSSVEINPLLIPPSTRRRTEAPRLSDIDEDVSREPRRRRLR